MNPIKYLSISALILAFFLPLEGIAQEETPETIEVVQGVVALGVEALAPRGGSETFSASVGKLYAFTKLTGIKEPSMIRHQWFYGDKMMAEIRLPVKPVSWRTYSSKTITPAWTGEWKVLIVDSEGGVLLTLPFTIE